MSKKPGIRRLRGIVGHWYKETIGWSGSLAPEDRLDYESDCKEEKELLLVALKELESLWKAV